MNPEQIQARIAQLTKEKEEMHTEAVQMSAVINQKQNELNNANFKLADLSGQIKSYQEMLKAIQKAN